MEYIDGADEIGDDQDEARVCVELGLGTLKDYGLREEPEPMGIDL